MGRRVKLKKIVCDVWASLPAGGSDGAVQKQGLTIAARAEGVESRVADATFDLSSLKIDERTAMDVRHCDRPAMPTAHRSSDLLLVKHSAAQDP